MVLEKAPISLNEWTNISDLVGPDTKLANRDLELVSGDTRAAHFRFVPIGDVRSFGRVPYLTYHFDGMRGHELNPNQSYELLRLASGNVEFIAWGENLGLFLQFSGENGVNVLEKFDSRTWFNHQTEKDNWDVVIDDSGLAVARMKVLIGEISDQEIEKIIRSN